MCQLTIIGEASTPFVNMRVLLNLLGLGDHPIYVVNGIIMTSAFFVVRVLYYPWIVYKMYCNGLFASDHFDSYPTFKAPFAKLNVFITFVMWILNYFWFYKMLKGCMKTIRKFN